MSLFKPTELRQFLDSLGVKAKKSLSQNFLIDGNILNKIVEQARVESNDLIVEIGPGPGALTQSLLKRDCQVFAIEKDHIFASHLNRLNQNDKLFVFEADFLNFEIVDVLKKYLKPNQKAKVVANLPYQLTTPILNRLMPLYELISSVTVMVQQEVAVRMTAKANSSDYSSLSIFLQFYSSPEYGFFVSRNCFYPAPKIDSAIVTLYLKQPPLTQNSEDFLKLIRVAFQHRRKMLRASLKEFYSSERTMEILTIIGKDPLSRPENLTLEEFLQFFLKINEV